MAIFVQADGTQKKELKTSENSFDSAGRALYDRLPVCWTVSGDDPADSVCSVFTICVFAALCARLKQLRVIKGVWHMSAAGPEASSVRRYDSLERRA